LAQAILAQAAYRTHRPYIHMWMAATTSCVYIYKYIVIASSVVSVAATGYEVCDASAVDAVSPIGLLQTITKKKPLRSRDLRCDDGDDGQQWLFILSSQGRTGSTTILGMVNSIPGYFLAGENEGIMADILDLEHKVWHLDRRHSIAYHHGQRSEQEVACAFKNFTRAFIGWPGFRPTTTGFKEIRHTKKEELDAFLHIFPNAKFIINTRNITEQAQSAWFRNQTDDEKQLAQRKQDLMHWGRKHSDRSFYLPLEDFSVARFNEMLVWLGVETCVYTKVLHLNDENTFTDAKHHVPSCIKCK